MNYPNCPICGWWLTPTHPHCRPAPPMRTHDPAGEWQMFVASCEAWQQVFGGQSNGTV